MKKIAPEKFYHIYLKDECILASIKEETFEGKWCELKAMIGMLRTEYEGDDLSYEVVETTPSIEESSY
tara:strand:- start:15580 stop:15783 length:204 start_codon:yes stop_codon:yes gene_type:complete